MALRRLPLDDPHVRIAVEETQAELRQTLKADGGETDLPCLSKTPGLPGPAIRTDFVPVEIPIE